MDPKGFKVEGGNNDHYVLFLERNLYGQKQAGRLKNKHLVENLTNNLGVKQPKIEECVFHRRNVLYVPYTDNSLLTGPDPHDMENVGNDLKKTKSNIDVQEFLGVTDEAKTD